MQWYPQLHELSNGTAKPGAGTKTQHLYGSQTTHIVNIRPLWNNFEIL